jgi:hypothetical protein
LHLIIQVTHPVHHSLIEHFIKPLKMTRKLFALGFGILLFQNASLQAQQPANQYNSNTRFEQIGSMLPTPNSYRSASGAP